MKIYISGISGTGMGALALFAKDAGYEVCGSDKARGSVTSELEKRNINIWIGGQDGDFLQAEWEKGNVDWFVYTSALSEDHPELLTAKKLGIRTSKRDELVNYFVEDKKLKMVAVAGTHGKTTTTAMLIWACKELQLPVGYLLGSTLEFANAGQLEKNAKILIYEADEYDRNFLHFHPWLAAITTISYDHPDIFKTEKDYHEAFVQFMQQSEHVVRNEQIDPRLDLAGEVRRFDATLALAALEVIIKEGGVVDRNGAQIVWDSNKVVKMLNRFPGAGRRFERIIDGVYSDYGHHPEEIAATIELAKEEAKQKGFKGLVAIYEPHQNSRQYEVRQNYKNVFDGVDKLFWLPTFLTREDPNLRVLQPTEFIQDLENSDIAESGKMDAALAKKLKKYHENGYLILLMTAGPADAWLRQVFTR